MAALYFLDIVQKLRCYSLLTPQHSLNLKTRSKLALTITPRLFPSSTASAVPLPRRGRSI